MSAGLKTPVPAVRASKAGVSAGLVGRIMGGGPLKAQAATTFLWGAYHVQRRLETVARRLALVSGGGELSHPLFLRIHAATVSRPQTVWGFRPVAPGRGRPVGLAGHRVRGSAAAAHRDGGSGPAPVAANRAPEHRRAWALHSALPGHR